MTKCKTGIEEFDRVIDDGIESSSRNLFSRPSGTRRTVFAMQFLGPGLLEGETVSFNLMNKSFPRSRTYSKSFWWDIESYEVERRFISMQVFSHLEPYSKDLKVTYFGLEDCEEMKRIDRLLPASHACVPEQNPQHLPFQIQRRKMPKRITHSKDGGMPSPFKMDPLQDRKERHRANPRIRF